MPIYIEKDLSHCTARELAFIRDRLKTYADHWGLDTNWRVDPPTRRVMFAVDERGTILGFQCFFPFPTFFGGRARYFLDFIWVEPQHRGGGLAEELLRRVRKGGENLTVRGMIFVCIYSNVSFRNLARRGCGHAIEGPGSLHP